MASSRPTTPLSAHSAGRSSTENSRSAPRARTVNDSPSAPSPQQPPAACNAARYSPISANYSPRTTAAIPSPPSPPEAPGTERLQQSPVLQDKADLWQIEKDA